jgi:hypothetical protein
MSALSTERWHCDGQESESESVLPDFRKLVLLEDDTG